MNRSGVKIGLSNKEGQLGILPEKGGLREGAGRKSIGTTKKASLTLTDETWSKLERECSDRVLSRSELIREIIEAYYS